MAAPSASRWPPMAACCSATTWATSSGASPAPEPPHPVRFSEKMMKYRYLGRSGLLGSRLCLGTRTFGNTDWGCEEAEARSIVRTFIEAGGNFLDTADAYGAGTSERILGTLLKEHRRADLVVATKGFFPMGDAATARGLSRKHIVEACEASLSRLGTDYIDLYQFHGPDPYTPIEESLRAADDLIRAGKVRYLGCSNFYGWQ